jgi:SWI2/SNF2 ATPase
MRNALPNAAFIGFTGTPLMAGEELTRQVFGDYVSIYNWTRPALTKIRKPAWTGSSSANTSSSPAKTAWKKSPKIS